MILKISVVEIQLNDVFPSTNCDKDIISFWDVTWDWFDQLIDWTKIDKESDIILCKRLFGFVSSSLLSLDEAGADSLDDDIVFLGNEQDALVCQIIHEVLLNTLETLIIAWDSDFVRERAL